MAGVGAATQMFMNARCINAAGSVKMHTWEQLGRTQGWGILKGNNVATISP